MDTYEPEQGFDAKNLATFLAGVLIGSLAGAVTMLLVVPQSGKKTRHQIQQKAIELRDQTATSMEGAMTQIRTTAEQIKTDVSDRAKSLKKQGQDVLSNQLESLSDAAKNGKKVIQGKPG
jgi:gas vesicle protein